MNSQRSLVVGFLLAGIAAGQASSQSLHPDMRAAPIGDIGQWFGADSYPPDAIRASRQGRVVAALNVSASGDVTSCTIKQSSGTASLDIATCQIAADHLRFNAATDHQGRPVASIYPLSVHWALPEGVLTKAVDVSAGPPKDSVVEAELTFDAEGKLLSCRPLTIASPAQVVSPCQGAKIGAQTLRKWVRNGRPVGATVVQRFTEHVTPDR